MEKIQPIYPIYIPSKGRADNCKTAKSLLIDDIPFYLVIEEQEVDLYKQYIPEEYFLVLPFSNQGSVIPARNFIKEHATGLGVKRHWQLDDNISRFLRWYSGKRIPCDAGIALKVCEDFTDRYTNIGVSGLNYFMWGINNNYPPFFHNVHVYSCCLIDNSLPYKWRGTYNEDTDYCLQVLSGGLCTVLLNVFLAHKTPTLQDKGGNTDEIYYGDGRVKMSRELERRWPHIVKTVRKFSRSQHSVFDAWKRWDTPLIRRDDLDWDELSKPNEYGMTIAQNKVVKSKSLRTLTMDYRKNK